jgi:hypothetical protein
VQHSIYGGQQTQSDLEAGEDGDREDLTVYYEQPDRETESASEKEDNIDEYPLFEKWQPSSTEQAPQSPPTTCLQSDAAISPGATSNMAKTNSGNMTGAISSGNDVNITGELLLVFFHTYKLTALGTENNTRIGGSNLLDQVIQVY